jgi:UDP-N-acetylmuramoyl-tripeptide--D-alanyl-D-alanine ligase
MNHREGLVFEEESTSMSAMTTLGGALQWIPGARLVGDPATPFSRVHTDTRTLMAGDLFVALQGEHHDAHDFLPAAR